MVQRKSLLITISLVITTLLSFFIFWPDSRLHLIACDVGQGDAILITQGFNQVLIDGGPSDKVLGCLARHTPFWDRRLELVVNTHPDYDHLRGLTGVLKHYEIGRLLTNSVYAESEVFNELHDLVRQNRIKVYSPRKDELIKLGSLQFKVLWPETEVGNLALWQNDIEYAKEKILGVSTDQRNLNELSIVLLLSFGDFEALLDGDITTAIEKKIVEECQGRSCGQPLSVLKVAHHGSKTSTSQELLDFFKPQTAIISVGENQWGHPTEEVLKRLNDSGVKILRTDELGDIEFTTDGRRIYK